jgi:hypothetical protein
VGSNTSIYIDGALVNNDVISLEMTSSANCVSPQTVTSNSILMTVSPNLTPSVTIAASQTNICSGASVTFTATALNAGSTPSYQWKVNGTGVGTNAPTYVTTSLTNGATVICDVTSSAACNTVNPVTSNTVTMTVTTAPASPVASSNSPVPLNGTLELYASTIPGANYTWGGPNGFNSTSQNPSILNATPLLSGTYWVVATIGTCSSPADSVAVVVSGASPTVNISGTVRSELSQGINLAKVKLTGDDLDSLMTNSDGAWNFDVTQGDSYVVTPTKNNDVINYNGITTLDIVLMQRHILNVQLLSSPYKIIAADVNGSQTVTTLDIVLTKSLILQNITTFPGGKLWNFVNSDFVFSVPTSPFPFENSRSYSSVTAATNQDFIGCKLGDVNNSWDPGVAKFTSPATIGFSMPNVLGSQGQIISIPVTVKDFNGISGFQYSISWDPSVLEYVSATDAALDMDFGTSQTEQGKLGMLWSTENLSGRTLADGSTVFEIQFRILASAGASSSLQFNGQMTVMEAVNAALEIITINSENGSVTVDMPNGIESGTPSNYALMQNVPNPFEGSTQIVFILPIAEQATLSIYDIHGKLVWETEGQYAAGTHVVRWDALGTDGVRLSDGTYYYRLRTPNYSATRKMVLIR